MKCIILGGFLGSGKTTVLIDLAKYLVKRSTNKSGDIPIAIIENEVGEIGIDNQIIEAGNYKVSTLFSGCICCTLVTDLTLCINDIAEKINPNYIIIEATGLAYPGKIADIIKKYAPKCEEIQIFTVVDAQRWDENMDELSKMISNQIKPADIVFLNKTDTIDEEKKSLIYGEIEVINCKAQIFPISAIEGINHKIWNKLF